MAECAGVVTPDHHRRLRKILVALKVTSHQLRTAKQQASGIGQRNNRVRLIVMGMYPIDVTRSSYAQTTALVWQLHN